MSIYVKNQAQIEKMRVAGRIVAETHELLTEKIEIGMSTYELDQIAENYIRSQKAIPSFKNYNGFPAATCISINEQVVHGIPSKQRIIKDGDVVSVDIGAYIDGYHGDAARTHGMGNISAEAAQLIEVTKESFFKGAECIKEGVHLFEISNRIHDYVDQFGYSVVRDMVGHGIGRNLHEDPQIPNYRQKRRGPQLKAGMVIAVEPMVNIGSYMIRILADDWTAVTVDNSLSAHYENTILVTKQGCEFLTML